MQDFCVSNGSRVSGNRSRAVASLGERGRTARVTPSRGGDTRMKFKKLILYLERTLTDKRGRTAKKGHHVADCND